MTFVSLTVWGSIKLFSKMFGTLIFVLGTHKVCSYSATSVILGMVSICLFILCLDHMAAIKVPHHGFNLTFLMINYIDSFYIFICLLSLWESVSSNLFSIFKHLFLTNDFRVQGVFYIIFECFSFFLSVSISILIILWYEL